MAVKGAARRAAIKSPQRGDAGKGAILSRERMAPFRSPKRTQGEGPLTPHIGSFYLEELHALRIAQPLAALLPYGCGIPLAGNQVRCTWLRHESLRVGSFSNRALLREARVTVAWRQTTCGGGIAALAALFSLLLGGSC